MIAVNRLGNSNDSPDPCFSQNQTSKSSTSQLSQVTQEPRSVGVTARTKRKPREIACQEQHTMGLHRTIRDTYFQE